jgi:putative transposase
LKRKHRGYGDTSFIDEVFAGVLDHKINGKQHYLWRAVDQDDEVVDVFLHAKRDCAAAKRFLKRLLRPHGGEARKIVTDKLRSYGVAQQFLSVHAAVYNLFNLGRHLVGVQYYRDLRMSAFTKWSSAVA